MSEDPLSAEISHHVWEAKYRYQEAGAGGDATISDTWRRVARALASVERTERGLWEQRFFQALEGFRFIPGGRILAGAGTHYRVTLFNCFVMGTIEDSMDGIFEALKEGARTLQRGGGVGYDFSTLRPRGSRAAGAGKLASGPVSFMHIWDQMCSTVMAAGARRGAMMGVLRCDHPDIEEFIAVKADPARLRHFNLSVAVTDAFMDAVRRDEEWALVFPVGEGVEPAGEEVERVWSGSREPKRLRVFKRLRARELWGRIMRATYDYAEPGVIFIDRINALNNLAYCEQIGATNPCGEVPLPPYGACDLGSINLTRFVLDPFTPRARLDFEGVERTATVAVRMLDNVYDLSQFPLPQQAEVARATRRLGLGLTGLADALIMLGVGYGSGASFELAQAVMATVCQAAYRASVAIAREKGAFPEFQAEPYLASPFVSALPGDIRDGIARFGIRNSHLTSIAPAGTISLLANNVSSGLEPVYQFRYLRRVRQPDGEVRTFPVTDFAYRLFRDLRGGNAPLPSAFVTAADVTPAMHIAMQAVLQRYVDNAISKTINVPEDFGFEDFQSIYLAAYGKGLKGCTTFRPNPVTGRVLLAAEGGREGGEEVADFDSFCQPALGKCT